MTTYNTFVFDLDGTLLDTSPGIFASMKRTEEELGLRATTLPEQRSVIGPPLEESFARLYKLEGQGLLDMMTVYDRYYGSARGAGCSTPYEGMIELLDWLRAQGCKLAIATMKPAEYTAYTLEPYNLAERFDAVACYDDQTCPRKSDLILRVMDKLGADPAHTLMIGDSAYDGDGAQQAGVDFAAVTGGFGFTDPSELERIPHALKVYQLGELRSLLEAYFV